MAVADFRTVDGVKIFKDDWKYFNEKPSPNFSPAKNKAIIKSTIEKSIKARQERMKLAVKGIEERADALGAYFKHLNTKDTSIENYFGRKELARLRGRHILKTAFRAANGQTGVRLGWSDQAIDYLDYEY